MNIGGKCELYERNCIGCRECDLCDLDNTKTCDNCGKCLGTIDYSAIKITKIITNENNTQN